MNTYTYTPRFVCSREIRFDIENGKRYNVRFEGGCEGKLHANGTLTEGQDAAFEGKRRQRPGNIVRRPVRPGD